MVSNLLTSANHCCIFAQVLSPNSVSQSTPRDQISCSRIFAWTTNGTSNPKGSNIVAIFLKKFLLLKTKLSSSGSTLKENISSFSIHIIPKVFIVGKKLSSRLTDFALSSGGMFFVILLRSWTSTFWRAYQHLSILTIAAGIIQSLSCDFN